MTLSSASSSVVRRTKDMTFLPQPLPLPSRRQKTSSTTTKASRSASKLKRSTTNSAAKSATEKKAHHHSSAMGSVSAKEASQTGPALRHDKSITASTSKQSGKRDRSNSTDSMPPSAVSASNRATTQPFKTVSGSTTGSSAAIHPDSPFDPTNTALSTLESRPNKRQKLTQESVPGRTSPDASQVTAELQAGDSISQIAGKFDATSAPTETESPFDDKTSQNGGDADSRQWSVHCPYMEEFKDKSSAFRFVQPQYRPKQAATIMEANETMVIDYNPSDVQSEQHYQELVFMGPGANLQKHAWIIPYLDPLHALVYALDKTKFNRRIGDFSYEMLYLLQSIREKIAYATGFGKAKVYFQSQHVSRMAAEPHVKHLDTMDDPEEPETVAPSG
ncbi:hypothetical protein MIND_01077200 [Mycena indigotica]|uniref:Uncharacterized protein n=1 Tax=Mycena indigotica TaxID=2126181 RepID=A0A8H6SBP3_9AGAR|nr:uncharacterized protein MIND_01077200 [Mycena indigotica]KAF7295377.1 hypothetical protein MIND_01077200 [Mycena indigotica]